MKVLITGGSGFLGKGAAYEALARGHDIVILDRVEPSYIYQKYPGHISAFNDDEGFHLIPFQPHKDGSFQQITYYQTDITDKKSMASAFKHVDLVLHTAAIFNHHSDYETYAKVNVLGSKNVRDLSLDNGVQCIVNYGAGLGYGSTYDRPITEDDPVHPEDPYSQSKVEGEEEIFHGNGSNLETILMRIFGAYGEEQVYGLPAFLKTVYNGIAAVPWKKTVASYVHRDDISRAALYLAENHHGNRNAYMPSQVAYNLADKTPASMLELSRALKKVKRHITLPLPSWLVRLSGKIGDLLNLHELNSRIANLGLHNYAADCAKLVNTGFEHKHPSVLESMLPVYQHYAEQWDAEKKPKLLKAKF